MENNLLLGDSKTSIWNDATYSGAEKRADYAPRPSCTTT